MEKGYKVLSPGKYKLRSLDYPGLGQAGLEPVRRRPSLGVTPGSSDDVEAACVRSSARLRETGDPAWEAEQTP